MSNQAGLRTKNVQSGWVGDQKCPVRLGWGPRMSSQAGLGTKNVQSGWVEDQECPITALDD